MVTKRSKKPSGAARKGAKPAAAARKPAAPPKRKPASQPARPAGAKVATAAPRKEAAPARAAKPAARQAAAARPAAVRKVAPKKVRRRTPTELRKFKQRLIEERGALLAAYESTKGDSRNRVDDGTEDYIDYAVSSYDREFLLSLTELERRQLVLVEEALKKIERGGADYGRCAQCMTEIPAKRLEVQPWARYCIQCQELDERGLLMRPEGDEEHEDGAGETAEADEGLLAESEESGDLDDALDEESEDDPVDADRLLND